MDYDIFSGNTRVATAINNRITILDSNRCPLYLCNWDNFEGWLEKRAIDSHRTNSRLLKRVLRLSSTDDIGAVLKFNAATITDNFWVKEDGASKTFEQVKSFKDDYAMTALQGSISIFDMQSIITPELTNIGSFEKCWLKINDSWYLIKSEKEAAVVAEIFISFLGRLLGFNMAFYSQWKRGYVMSKDFTAGKHNFQPASSIIPGSKEIDYLYIIEKLAALGDKALTDILNIFFLDAIVMNYDRHLENYGILTDCETGEFVSIAPNFDNNLVFITGEDDKIEPRTSFMRDYIDVFQKYPLPVQDEKQLLDALECAWSSTLKEIPWVDSCAVAYKYMLFEFILNSYRTLVQGTKASLNYLRL